MLLFGHGYSLGIYRQFTLLLLTTFEFLKKIISIHIVLFQRVWMSIVYSIFFLIIFRLVRLK